MSRTYDHIREIICLLHIYESRIWSYTCMSIHTHIWVTYMIICVCWHMNTYMSTLDIHIRADHEMSFANPRNDIFMRSLKGELAKRPQLIDLKPADGDEDPPEVLFGNHRKGYFKARHLCRVWTLQTLKWLRTRGEFFVVWKEGDEVYDGRRVLAHAFTIKYISLHQPGIWMYR